MLSLDPIGDFLERCRLEGTILPVTDRAEARRRLEAFRREFPALPLQKMGGVEIEEYVAGEAGRGVPPSDLAVTKELAAMFLKWAHSDPGAGSGLHNLPGGGGSEMRHSNPYATRTGGPDDGARPRRSGAGGGWAAFAILAGLAAAGAGAYWLANQP